MNIKIIGSVVRWLVVIGGAIGVFASDPTFTDTLNKLKESIASGDTVAIVGGSVTLITLGWSIWDKIKTQKTEIKLKSEIADIKMLNAKMIEQKGEK